MTKKLRNYSKFVANSILVLLSNLSFAQKQSESFGFDEYFCAVYASSCKNQDARQAYKNKLSESLYRKINGVSVKIPMTYLDSVEFIEAVDSTRRGTTILVETIFPDLEPKSEKNLRSYLIPYSSDLLRIKIGELSKDAKPWNDVVRDDANLILKNAISPTKKKSKYGLKVQGEDYAKNPTHVRCESLNQIGNNANCGQLPAIEDVLISSKPHQSILICDPDEFPDAIEFAMAMSEGDRESFYASGKWIGLFRASCKHKFYYQPLNSHITITYPRRLLSKWEMIESKTQTLLATFVINK